MTATLLALIGGVFNTGNDLVYRRISLSGRDIRFPFYLFSTVAAFLTAAAACLIVFRRIDAGPVTVLFGAAMGVLSFVTYFLFLLSFSGANTQVSATIYRMNLVPGVVFAAIFLGEAVTAKRTLGICLCAASVMLFAGRMHTSRREVRFVLLALASCLCGGFLNYVNRTAMLHGAAALPLLFWRFLAASFLAAATTPWRRSPRLERREAGLAAAGGFCLTAAILFLLEAFKIAEVGRVLPTSHVFSIALVAVITRIFFNERITLLRAAGLVAAAASIVLVN